MNMIPPPGRRNPVFDVAGSLPIYSSRRPIRPRYGLGKVQRNIPLTGTTGRFNIKPLIPMSKYIPHRRII